MLMIRASVIAASLILALVALASTHRPDETKLPSVALLYGDTYDFGDVSPGAILEARFPLENEGGRRLIIVEKSRSCDCIRAGQEELFVPPGGQMELVARLDTRKASGPMRLEIEYWTNAPNRPQLRLVLLANIRHHGKTTVVVAEPQTKQSS
jgi:hypothetical protein